MKKVSNILARMEASLNGSLDGLELDNTYDVIEKSTVIEMIKDLKMLVNEAQQQVKNLNIPAVIKSVCKHKKKMLNADWTYYRCEDCNERFKAGEQTVL